MSLRGRIMSLIGFFLALLLGIGAWGVWSTKRVQERVLEKHISVSDAEMGVLMAQVNLQKQEDEWKNVLLRGHEAEKLREHWAKFEKNEQAARENIVEFRAMLPEDSVVNGLAEKFLRDHEELGSLYREALVVFQVGGEGAQLRGDGLVRGRAKSVVSNLRDIGEILKADRALMENSVREIRVRRSIATIGSIVITALLAFVVLALALNHWMDLSILTAGRSEAMAERVGFARSSRNRVLVVEKDDLKRKKMAEDLGSWGCQVLAAGSASEAARILELDGQAASGGNAELVVMGGGMVGDCGVALARWLRAEKSTCGIPLVLIDSDDSGRSGGIGAIFDEVLASSMGGKKLEKKLTGLMQKAGEEKIREAVPLDLAVEYPRVRGLRILVAEDEPLNRKYLGLMLDKVGLDYELVGNGREAVEALESEQFAVVLMDCSMPVMDGFEATRKIRETEGEKGRSLVVGVTAHTDAGAQEKCRKAGMDFWVSKPVKLEYLCLVIEEGLAAREVRA